jgi:transcriptional regulator with XRE-family HTH domain
MGAITLTLRFGQTLREQRLSRGLGQRVLAEIIGCDPTYISQLENCGRNPSLVTIERVAIAFGMPAWKLLKLAEESPPTRRGGGGARG